MHRLVHMYIKVSNLFSREKRINEAELGVFQVAIQPITLIVCQPVFQGGTLAKGTSNFQRGQMPF